jgi:GPH family glycoside/pentoside/hexuronide:cation symporter
MKEDKELIDRQLRILEEVKEKISFWKTLNYAMKNKNFIAYAIAYMGHQVMAMMMLASLPYWNKYIIGSSDPEIETVLAAGFLIAVLISVPLWSYIGRKYGNKKAFMMGTLLSTFLFIPMFFISDLILSTIFIALIGIGIGAIWVLMYPCFSDVIDDIVIQTEKRQEGAYTGLRTFFGRFPIVFQAIAFAIVHPLTGYRAGAPPGPTSQTLLAQFGIRLLMVGIPMVFYFLGFIIIWKVYNLDKETVLKNTEFLKQKHL